MHIADVSFFLTTCTKLNAQHRPHANMLSCTHVVHLVPRRAHASRWDAHALLKAIDEPAGFIPFM